MQLKLYRSIILWATAISVIFVLSAKAQSPLGIGVAEPIVSPDGYWSKLALYISVWQHQFERSISAFLVGIKESPEDGLKLLGLSFIYGILHAIGPGHGKAVISSYLLAENESLKRGIVLSFLSSLLQAVSAIVIVALVYFMLPARLTEAAGWATKASFGLIMLLGIGLLYRKTRKLIQGRKRDVYKQRKNAEIHGLFDQPIKTDQECDVSISKFSNYGSAPQATSDMSPRLCDICGNTHIFSANFVQKPLKWKTALLAIFSIGIRPCTGAIFVMSFAMLNQLTWIGSLSVLAMSLGTFITVSLLATIAVKAKGLAIRFMSKKNGTGKILSVLEWCFALAIFLLGLAFFVS